MYMGLSNIYRETNRGMWSDFLHSSLFRNTAYTRNYFWYLPPEIYMINIFFLRRQSNINTVCKQHANRPFNTKKHQRKTCREKGGLVILMGTPRSTVDCSQRTSRPVPASAPVWSPEQCTVPSKCSATPPNWPAAGIRRTRGNPRGISPAISLTSSRPRNGWRVPSRTPAGARRFGSLLGAVGLWRAFRSESGQFSLGWMATALWRPPPVAPECCTESLVSNRRHNCSKRWLRGKRTRGSYVVRHDRNDRQLLPMPLAWRFTINGCKFQNGNSVPQLSSTQHVLFCYKGWYCNGVFSPLCFTFGGQQGAHENIHFPAGEK